MNEEKKTGSKKNLLIALLLVVAIVALCVAGWAVFFRQGETPLAPDHVPVEEDPLAKPVPGDSGEKLENPAGGGSVSLTYAKEVTVQLSDKNLSLLFANPSRSNQDVVLQVLIQDQLIAQSGTLKPGNQITEQPLAAGAEKILQAGLYDGIFRVACYDPETGEKAMVNTEIPVMITVNP